MNDPNVDEVRRMRDAHAAMFNYDLDSIFQDIKEQEKKSGLKFVSYPPHRTGPHKALPPTGASGPRRTEMRYEDDDTRMEAQGLESPCDEFRMNNRRVIMCLVISSVMCLASLAVIVVGFVVAFPEPAINKRVISILVGTTGVVLSLLLFASNWKKHGQHVVVFPGGFRFHKGGRWSEVPWEDVVAVWRHSSTIGSSLVLVETDLWIQVKDGKTIYLTSFFLDMARLVEIVLTETARRMFPAMSSQLQHGQTVVFGNLEISATELIASGKSLAWDDVHAIQVAHGAIDIQRKEKYGSWYYSPIKKMPNYHLFLALSETRLKAVGTERQEKEAF